MAKMTKNQILDLLDQPLEQEQETPELVPADFLEPGAMLPPFVADDPAEQNLHQSANAEVVIINRNGMPVQRLRPAQFRTETEEMLMELMSLPYTKESFEKFTENASSIQKIAAQLVMKAGNGDLDAIKYSMDRVLGKPKQHVEKISATMNYEDFLKMLSEDQDGPEPSSQSVSN